MTETVHDTSPNLSCQTVTQRNARVAGKINHQDRVPNNAVNRKDADRRMEGTPSRGHSVPGQPQEADDSFSLAPTKRLSTFFPFRHF